MYADEDTNTPGQSKWPTLAWLLPVGVALLLGFGAGWASGRVANESGSKASFRFPLPSPLPSVADGAPIPGEPVNLGMDGLNADPESRPTPKLAID
jgi:hypothetical protein